MREIVIFNDLSRFSIFSVFLSSKTLELRLPMQYLPHGTHTAHFSINIMDVRASGRGTIQFLYVIVRAQSLLANGGCHPSTGWTKWSKCSLEMRQYPRSSTQNRGTFYGISTESSTETRPWTFPQKIPQFCLCENSTASSRRFCVELLRKCQKWWVLLLVYTPNY